MRACMHACVRACVSVEYAQYIYITCATLNHCECELPSEFNAVSCQFINIFWSHEGPQPSMTSTRNALT